MAPAPKPTPNFDKDVLEPLRKAQAEAAAKAAAEEAARAAAEAEAARLAAQTAYVAPMAQYVGDATAIMDAAGIASGDRFYVDYIINNEAGWNGATTYNRSGSGAYGICQALPGGKMASAGADWQTNPVTQLRWCASYAVERYGSWSGAYSAWLRQNWW